MSVVDTDAHAEPLFSFPSIPPRLSAISTASNSTAVSRAAAVRESVKSPRSPASPFFDPLAAALSTAQTKYTLSNPKSLAAHNEACQDFPGGNTRTVLHSSPFPITFTSGKGCEVTSQDGETYVDFLGEYTAGLFGHSNPIIAAAVQDALEHGWNLGGPNTYERSLARKICKRFSASGIEQVRFTNSGTESNTMALAAAVAYTSRKKILVFQKGYHGGTLSFPENLHPEMHTNLPHDFVLAPYNDIEGTRKVIESLPPQSLAAVLVELVQGSGGAIPGTPEFLRYLDQTAHSLGAVFIVDEVMTSRLSYHGLSAELGLTPDLVTLGKWVGGGMTFGAFGGRKSIMSLFDPRSAVLGHSGTFNNNVFTMAAGCAGIDLYTEEEVKRLNSLGEELKSSITAILSKYSIRSQPKPAPKPCPKKNELESPFTGIETATKTEQLAASVESLSLSPADIPSAMWVSGRGSMLNINFAGQSDGSLRALFWHHMLEHGIYLAQRGFIALNMEIQKRHIDSFAAAVEKFVSRYRQALS
ncbi:Beta-phenylalanine transaminase [Phlyctema vagabunda]|uniref:Beta-phenylalanine transaminase n=1 Tax=Phlyctema vagabunda TaxID=108571 RepID=A0ABR4PTA4_9HELO